MTQEELEEIKELEKKIKKIFSDLKDEGGYICFADTFYCEDDEVAWHGVETGSYQYYEEHNGYFPIEYLSFTDDELRDEVVKKNIEYKKRLEKEREEKEKAETEKRRKLFETLKKEFD